MRFFYFKNKDTVLAKTVWNGERFALCDLYINLKPVLYMLYSDDKLNKWIEDRATVLNRPYSGDLFKTAGIHDSLSFVESSMCLSLTDTFWITEKTNISWKSVSLFRNSFLKVFTKIASGGMKYNGVLYKSPSPELCTDGASAKCFKRQDNNIYLYKSSGWINELLYSGIYSEYFVTQFIKALKLDNFVSYELVRYNDVLWSKCRLFTSEDVGLIPICNLCNDWWHLDDHIHNYSGLSQMYFKQMMVVDAFTLNVDRHGENIAVLFDTNDLEIMGIAPVYDFDHSLFYDIPLVGRSKDYITELVLKKVPKTYADHSFLEQAQLCMTSDMHRALKSINGFTFKNNKKFPMNEKRMNMVNKVFKWYYELLMRGI